jgi:hypothetical protein
MLRGGSFPGFIEATFGLNLFEKWEELSAEQNESKETTERG